MKNSIALLALLVSYCVAQSIGPNPGDDNHYDGPLATELVRKQAFIWVPLGLAFTLLMALCVLCRMDPDKSQDTIIYAKFIGNFDKKTN